MSPTPDVPVPMPRRRSRRFLLAGVVVAVLLAGAGTAAGLLIFRKPPPVDPRALALAELSASATPTETPFTGDLRSLLLPIPANARPFVKPFSADGALTIAQVADWYGVTADALADSDITAGAMQQWHQADGTLVSIMLLNFPRAITAHRWASSLRDLSYRDNVTDDSPIPGFPESGLFYGKQPEDNGTYLVTGFAAKKDISMAVSIYAPPPVNHQAVTTLLEQQLARLP